MEVAEIQNEANLTTSLDGVIVVDKPQDWTSHDVVAKMRGIARTRRVGHLGTLDPIATGVLPLMIGNVTRLAQFWEKSEKIYEAIIQFGFATTTYDRAGTPTTPVTNADIGCDELEAGLASMRGEIDQLPPPVSAKKIGGVPAYKLARKNIPVELKPVRITVYELSLRSLEGSRARIYVRCSAGTYIRSIAHDLGVRLGCGAYITELTRLASGPFHTAQSRTIGELSEMGTQGQLVEALVPAPDLLPHFPNVFVDDIAVAFIRQGRDFNVSPFRVATGTEHVKAIDGNGKLKAIGKIVLPNVYHPIVVL